MGAASQQHRRAAEVMTLLVALESSDEQRGLFAVVSMLGHFTARLFTFAALFAAGRHVLVLGELLAFLCTSGASIRAGLADHP